MARFARLNEAGEIVEYRELPGQPEDIPHKGVRWRPVLEDDEPDGFDPVLHTLCSGVLFDDQRQVVRTAKTIVDRPIEPERERAIERIRRAYRDRIVDALPDMAEVARLAGERDQAIAAIGASSDLALICQAAQAAPVSKHA